MLDLESAIKHCEEVAEKNEESIAYYTIQGDKEWLDECEKDCIEYAKECRQIAKWLMELKKYRAIFEKVGKILADNGYMIDDLDTIFGKVNEEIKTDADSD